MRFQYPILLDVTERSCLIVGGGAVAARKARGLLSAGARRVRVVAPELDEALPPAVQRVRSAYDPSHLDGADLVFALTDLPEVNAQIVSHARQRGLLVCRADDDEEHAGNFIVPAVHRGGAVIVAVSAGSPALSAAIRDGIAARFDPRWVRMAEAMRTLRPRLRADTRLTAARRREIFHDLAGEEALIAADRAAGAEEMWTWLVQRHPDLARPQS